MEEDQRNAKENCRSHDTESEKQRKERESKPLDWHSRTLSNFISVVQAIQMAEIIVKTQQNKN